MFILQSLTLLRGLLRRSHPAALDFGNLLVAIEGDHRPVRRIHRLTGDSLTLSTARYYQPGTIVSTELLNRPALVLRKRSLKVTKVQQESGRAWQLCGRFEPPLDAAELDALLA